MNLDPEYWSKKFLYPYALDTAPIKAIEIPPVGATLGQMAMLESHNIQPVTKNKSDQEDILETKRFQFPLSHLDQKKEYYEDIIQPITILQDDIIKDMFRYAREFPIKVIPHVTEQGEINDTIHNYKRPKFN